MENSNKRIPAEQTLLKENRAGEPWEKSRARALYYPRPIFDVKKEKNMHKFLSTRQTKSCERAYEPSGPSGRSLSRFL